MDAAQQFAQPFLNIWRRLSRTQQVGLGVLAAAGLGLLFVVSSLSHAPDSAVAFSGLSDEEMATVAAKLKDAKIPYELADRGTVKVPSAQVNEARVALAGEGLGGKPPAGSGFEFFTQPTFGQTEFSQSVNYQRALENELARSIGRMDAVEWSRVHLVIPQPTLFASQQKDATASIILKLKPGKRFDRAQVQSISNLVTGSVQGLKAQNVKIVDVNGTTLSGDDGADGPSGLTSRQLDTTRGYEAGVQRDLQALLDRVLGAGRAAVRVSADMNWDQVEQTSETYSPGDPAQAPVRSSHEVAETTTGAAGQAGGVPGPASNNGSVPSYQAPAGGGAGTSQKTDRETNYELNKQVQKVVRAPGAVKRLSVSVMLDGDPNNPDPALVKSVQDAVTAAVGLDTTRGDQLVVTPLAFNRQDLQSAEAAMADAARTEQTMNYVRLGALVAGPLLLLLVLWLILRGGRRKESRVPAGAATPAAAFAGATSPAAAGAAAAVVAAHGGQPRPLAQPITEDPQRAYIRDQITTLAKSNPAMVAQLIQTWVDEDRRN